MSEVRGSMVEMGCFRVCAGLGFVCFWGDDGVEDEERGV